MKLQLLERIYTYLKNNPRSAAVAPPLNTLAGLPAELLVRIMEFLPTSDLLKLTLVNQRFRNAANSQDLSFNPQQPAAAELSPEEENDSDLSDETEIADEGIEHLERDLRNKRYALAYPNKATPVPGFPGWVKNNLGEFAMNMLFSWHKTGVGKCEEGDFPIKSGEGNEFFFQSQRQYSLLNGAIPLATHHFTENEAYEEITCNPLTHVSAQELTQLQQLERGETRSKRKFRAD